MITIVQGHLIKINATNLPQKKLNYHGGTGFTVYAQSKNNNTKFATFENTYLSRDLTSILHNTL